MELNVVRKGSQLKASSTLSFAGNQIPTPVLKLTEQGANTTFSTELQVMDVRFTLNFQGKRDGKNLSGSVIAVRNDGTSTVGTWDLRLQEVERSEQTIFQLPAPTGTNAVGRTAFHVRDLSRKEVMTDDPRDFRELMVHIWYPAEDPPNASSTSYFPELEAVQSEYSESRQIVLRFLRSHAVDNAAIARRHYSYPVLIFSPGASMSGFFYTAIIEDLASRGFIVVAIDHPFESQAVVFPNNRIAKYDEGQVSDVLKFARERIEVRAADISFVINELGNMNRKAGMFRGRIDLARLGAFGHSRGGLAAAMACQRDARLKACLNMDGGTLGGPFYPPGKNAHLNSGFMWFVRFKPEPTDEQLQSWKMTRQQWDQNRDRIESRVNGYFRRINSNSYRVTLNGASHLTFSDLPLNSSQLDLQTAALRFRLLRTVRAYTMAFFEQTLRGQNSDLMNGASSEFPEVTIERFGTRLVH